MNVLHFFCKSLWTNDCFGIMFHEHNNYFRSDYVKSVPDASCLQNEYQLFEYIWVHSKILGESRFG